MKKSLFSIVAAVAALGFSAPAMAQDEVNDDVAMDDGDWSGVYVGGRLGYSLQSSDNDETILFDTDLDGRFGDTVRTAAGANAFSPGSCGGEAVGATPTLATGNRGVCRDDRDGTEFAGHIGVDAQIGALVGGVVAEFGRAYISDSVSAFSSTPAFYVLTRELSNHGSVRGRLGLAAGDMLFYGTGGVAYGRMRNTQTTSNTVNSFTLSQRIDNNYGYVFGGGIEHKAGRNFSVGFQYLYTALENDDDFRVRVGALATTPATNPFLRASRSGTDFMRTDERFDRHNVSATVSFRF